LPVITDDKRIDIVRTSRLRDERMTLMKGLSAARIVMALGVGRGNWNQASHFAAARFGENSREALATRAVSEVGTVTPNSDGWGDQLSPYVVAARELMEAVAEVSVVGRIGAVRVPLRTRIPVEGAGEVGSWLAEGGAISVGQADIGVAIAEVHTVAGILVLADELVRSADTRAAAIVRRRLIRSLAGWLDRQFLDATGGDPNGPDAATAGVTPITSSGDPQEDLAALIEAFAGDLQSASLVTDPITAARMALWRDSGGAAAFPRLSVRSGGEVIGLPVIVSRASPRTSGGGQLALLDGAGIIVADDGVSIDVSKSAALQMNTTPDEPTDASTVLVSLFQENLQAFRATQLVSWVVARAGGVAVVEGAGY
jgi:HK97 family phage major capsid protein